MAGCGLKSVSSGSRCNEGLNRFLAFGAPDKLRHYIPGLRCANGCLATSAAASAAASAAGAAAPSEAASPKASAYRRGGSAALASSSGSPQSYKISAHNVYIFNGSYDAAQLVDVRY